MFQRKHSERSQSSCTDPGAEISLAGSQTRVSFIERDKLIQRALLAGKLDEMN